MTLVDAFIALGGTINKTGTVSKKKIMEVIEKDFELKIDMEVSLE